MSLALGAPFVPFGPVGWIVGGVVVLGATAIGIAAMSESSDGVEQAAEPLDESEDRKEPCQGCRKDENGNDIITEDRAKHILDGDKSGGGHRSGTGKPGKTEFPPDWSDDKILDGVAETAKNGNVLGPAHRPGEVVKGGTVDGVGIETVVKPDGSVRTGYPTGGPGVVRNPR